MEAAADWQHDTQHYWRLGVHNGPVALYQAARSHGLLLSAASTTAVGCPVAAALYAALERCKA